MTNPKKLETCRISDSNHLVNVLNLGEQVLTGVFPKSTEEVITKGPLELVWCPDSGLLQLSCSYDLDEMYGDNYGYRSGLNQSMVRHLSEKVQRLEGAYGLSSGQLVVDIGSNDATSLKAYQTTGIQRIGIDPTAEKFREYYTDGIELVPDFFNKANFDQLAKGKKADLITSISMFYDLEQPLAFISDIRESLAPEGVWHFEQSYMPSMLRTCSYDTVCHEHLEYYSLTVVDKMLRQNGLRVLDVEMNAVNGGSFAVTAAHESSSWKSNAAIVDWMLDQEDRMGLGSIRPYRDFEERVFRHRQDLMRLVRSLVADGKKVFGYGASTKGNVLLQFCGFTVDEIPCIAEVNEEKFGAFTPGTNIPIVSEEDAREMEPDYFLVLPWHFRDGILQREQEFRKRGGKFIFPLPEIEII
ncbi:MAG: class I SAM-dependent methyltransferase [Verrucomicrobiales bacterium]|nr:class I SAM-dependent methyltransferase [Verrucomicrobiales bacterium]